MQYLRMVRSLSNVQAKHDVLYPAPQSTVVQRTRVGTSSLVPAVEGVDLTDLPSEHLEA